MIRRRFFYLLYPFISVAVLLPGFPSAVYAQPGWGVDVRISNTNRYAYHPQVVSSGTFVHLVWYEEAGGVIFYVRSTDNGGSWSTPFMICDSLGYSPSLTASDNFVHIAWTMPRGPRCVYRRSTDYGVTWGRFDTVTYAGYGDPYLEVVGDTVYFLAYYAFAYRTELMKSTNRGLAWGPFQVVAPLGSEGFAVQHPQIHVALGCWDSTQHSSEIAYVKSSDGGRSWSQFITLSDSDGFGSQWPAICADRQGNPHLTWMDHKYSPYPMTDDIFYRTSRDSGRTWVPIMDTLTTCHRAHASDIEDQGDTLHVVYEDEHIRPTWRNFELFYRMSTDLGRTWQQEVRLTFKEEHSADPCLAAGSNYLHLVWSDERDSMGAEQIYYKRKTLFGSAVSRNEDPREPSGLSFEIRPNPTPGPCEVRAFGVSISRVVVYDVLGRRVSNFIPKTESAFVWDGRDEQHRAVPEGVYFARLETGSAVVTRKIVVVK